MSEKADVENDTQEALPSNELTPRNSFSQDDIRTPLQIWSSHSLVGEELLASSRNPSLEFAVDVNLSPFTPSESTTPPSILLHARTRTPSFANSMDVPQSSQSAASSQKARNDHVALARPPRIPQQVGSTSLHNRKDKRHNPGQSHSDHSLLSALTDSSWESNSHSRVRKRTLSYDGNERSSPGNFTSASSHKSTPFNLLQPILSEETKPPVSIFTSSDLIPTKAAQHTKEKTISPQSIQTTSTIRNTKQPNSFPLQQSDAVPRIRTGSLGSARDADRFQPKTVPMSMPMPMSMPSIEKITAVTTTTTSQSVRPTGYSLADVTRDAEDAAEVIKKLESTRIPADSSKSLLPEVVDDNRVHDFESDMQQTATATVTATEDDDSSPRKKQAEQKSSSEPPKAELKELTEELMEGLPPSCFNPPVTKPDQNNAGKKSAEAAAGFATLHRGAWNMENGGGERKERKEGNQNGGYDVKVFGKRLTQDLECFSEFMAPHKVTIRHQFYRRTRLVLLPSLALAALLFYVFDNPPNYNYEDEEKGVANASVSWWLLFLGVRQPITLEMARISELFIIDFLTLRTKSFPMIIGTPAALLLAQSKGWPFQLGAWAIIDFILLWGKHKLAHHWLYWQNTILLMNGANPSGHVTENVTYTRILSCSIALGIAGGLKRSIMGKMRGKEVVVRYRTEMEALVKKLLLVSEVSYLAQTLEGKARSSESCLDLQDAGSSKVSRRSESGIFLVDSFEYSEPQGSEEAQTPGSSRPLSKSAENEIMILLDEWEETDNDVDEVEEISMESVFYFRRALSFISSDSAFSNDFGNSRTREECIENAQKLFERLVQNAGNDVLDFGVLCLIARTKDKSVSRAKVKELIRLFRPSRSGKLTNLDFVKSIDSVYKSLRFLIASIKNSSQIHQAYESIVSKIFSAFAFLIIVAIMGFDALSLLLSIGAILVASTLLIGTASSKFVEGVLLVLVRKPYDIGDRIEINSPTLAIDNSGSMGWIVEKVDLFTTTLRSGSTRKVATIANGALAEARIVNMKRSDKPLIQTYLKFGVATSKEQLELFRDKVTQFIKGRPREWSNMRSFRCTRAEADLGCIEYVIILQHRELWQNLTAIMESKGHLLSYCLEVQQELGIRYTAPPMPIDLNHRQLDDPTFTSILEDKKDI